MNINSKLIDCATTGDLAGVKAALDKGANVHADDDVVLRYATMNGYLEMVKYLIQNGANIHATDDYALRFAVENGYHEVAKYINRYKKLKSL